MAKKYMNREERALLLSRVEKARKKIEKVYKNGADGRVPIAALAITHIKSKRGDWRGKLSDTWHMRIFHPEMVAVIEAVAEGLG